MGEWWLLRVNGGYRGLAPALGQKHILFKHSPCIPLSCHEQSHRKSMAPATRQSLVGCDNRLSAHRNGEMDQSAAVGILTTRWGRTPEGEWAITDLHGVELYRNPGCEPDYFTIADHMEMMSKNSRGRTIMELVQTMGPTNLVLKQSIVPVVALVAGSPFS